MIFTITHAEPAPCCSRSVSVQDSVLGCTILMLLAKINTLGRGSIALLCGWVLSDLLRAEQTVMPPRQYGTPHEDPSDKLESSCTWLHAVVAAHRLQEVGVCMQSYVAEDGCLHIVADKHRIHEAVASLDLGRAQLLTRLSQFWIHRVR